MQGSCKVNKEQANNKISINGRTKKCNKCREVLMKFFESSPEIKTIEWIEETIDGVPKKTGDIKFTVYINDLGINSENYAVHVKAIFSNFMVDFFGEFLLRENIARFIELISEVNTKEYMEIVSCKLHKRFGMRMKGNVLTFAFHVSLLQNIMTEDLRRFDW